MAPKSKKNSRNNFNQSGATNNPVWRPQPRIPRPKINFDGNMLHGKTNILDTTVTTLAPAAKNVMFIDASAVATSVVQSLASNTTIPSNYSEYVYHYVQLEWFPRVGPTSQYAGVQVIGCYLDNPEQMTTAVAETTASSFSRIRSTRNMFFCNAWERKVFTIPLTRRLKMFNVNTGTAYNDTDVVNRSTQGMILAVVNNAIDPITATVLGNWIVSYRMELRNLTNGLT